MHSPLDRKTPVSGNAAWVIPAPTRNGPDFQPGGRSRSGGGARSVAWPALHFFGRRVAGSAPPGVNRLSVTAAWFATGGRGVGMTRVLITGALLGPHARLEARELLT